MTIVTKRQTLAPMLLLAAILLLAPLASMAQGPQRGERLVEQLKSRLSLTDDQTLKLRELVAGSREQAMKDREQYADDRELMMQAARARNENLFARIDSLLTEDQRAEFQKFQQEMKERGRDRSGNPDGERRPNNEKRSDEGPPPGDAPPPGPPPGERPPPGDGMF
jgi:hypothetical protein